MDPVPLVSRELYVAGRRGATYRARMAAGAAGMGLTVWAFLVWGGAHGNGAWIYRVLLLLAALVATGGGILLAVDRLSRERREGTLGFLFLTELRAVDIVLGKFAAAALVPGCMLLALFPGLALCQLLGGISGAEFWRGVLALLVTLTFSVAAGIFVSAHCEDHRKALAGTTVLLLFLSPVWLCLLSFETGYHFLPILFWAGTVTFAVLAGVLLNSAATSIAIAWRDSEQSGLAKEERREVRAVSESQPVAWMMLRRRAGKTRAAWLTLIAPLLAFALLAPFVSRLAWAAIALLLLFVAHLGVQVVLFLRTAYSFYTDRQDGSLELLLGTKLSAEDVFLGFHRFLWRQTFPLLVAVCLVDVLAASVLFTAGHPMALLPLAMGGALFATVLGLGSTGVYRSLMTDHPGVAMIGTFLRLSFFPTLIAGLCMAAPRTELAAVAGFWVTASGFTTMFFASDANMALRRHGRELLLRPFSEKPPEIENEWSFINWETPPATSATA